MTIHISALKIPLSNDAADILGDIRLRLYQSQLRHCEARRILLEAPTSSGKTLAYLIRAIETRNHEPRFGTTIIVYPTNALTWDQADALHNLITEKIGKKVNLTVESDGDAVRWRTEDPNADVDLYVMNGETLAALSEEAKRPEGKAIIEQLRRNQAKSRIILTNPEVLYYMFLYKFAKNEVLLDNVFSSNPPNLLILDEFHLYFGYTLATISYMLAYMKNYFDQIIFSSATPIDVESIINEPCERIKATSSPEGDVVRYPTDLELEGTNRVLSQDDVSTIKRLVDAYYEQCKSAPQSVKVLAILSSVITCVKLQETLEDSYPNQVSAIHGLAPPRSRPRRRSDFKPIVVGTSAIEVGVDFDTSSLVFEAHDYSSFIQRLGRGARHNRCCTTSFIPTLYLGDFTAAVPAKSDIKPNEVYSIASRILPNLPSYTSFPLSAQATPILFAILLNWTIMRSAGGGRRKLNDGMAINELMQQVKDDNIWIPQELAPFKERLLDICRESPGAGVLKMARNISCRSSLGSIPAVFTNTSQIQFDELSLQDLPKLQFIHTTRDSLQSRGIKIPWKMRLRTDFLEVKGIRQKQEKVNIAFKPGRFEVAPDSLTKFNVRTEDQDLADKIFHLLNGQPAYVLHGKDDWRLPGFYTFDRTFLVIGGDAYLAWFIREARSKTVESA